MTEEKSFVYTLILGVCMIISMVLIGRMLLTPRREAPVPEGAVPEDTQEQQMEAIPEGAEPMPSATLTLTNVELSSIITDALPISIENLEVGIQKDGTVHMQGAVTKESLAQSVDGGTPRTIFMFLPDVCDASVSLKLGLAEGAITVSDVQASVAGMELPDTVIAPLAQSLSQKLEEACAAWGIDVHSIQFKTDEIMFHP